MRIIRQQCDACRGFGHQHMFAVVTEGTAELVEVPCGECNGVGHIKYVGFSIEEAKEILKHCGLSTEELED